MKSHVLFSLFAILLCITSPAAGQNLDWKLYDNIQSGRNTANDGVMNGITQSCYPIALALPLGQFVYSLVKHDEISILRAAQTAGGLVIATALTYGIKYSAQRHRPYETHAGYTPYEYDTSPSMPSGHTSVAFATATALSLEYKKWYVVVPAYLYAGAVGYSRLHLGAHYPSDVLVGALVGAGSSFVSYHAALWWKKKWEHKTQQKFIE